MVLFNKRQRRKTHYVPDGGVDLYAPAGLTEWGDMWDHSEEMDSADVLEFVETMLPEIIASQNTEDVEAQRTRMHAIGKQAIEKLLMANVRDTHVDSPEK